MRIRIVELRRIVKSVIKEAQAATVSAQLSPKEREMAQEMPRWGKHSRDDVRQSSPNSIKAKQVAAILSKKGLANDASNKKKITQGLLPYLDKMDPGDVFVADPTELARQFAIEVLGVKDD